MMVDFSMPSGMEAVLMCWICCMEEGWIWSREMRLEMLEMNKEKNEQTNKETNKNKVLKIVAEYLCWALEN